MLKHDRIDISEGIDINKKVHQNNVKYSITGIFQIKNLNMHHIFAMVVMI